jgi:hypothetical protein
MMIQRRLKLTIGEKASNLYEELYGDQGKGYQGEQFDTLRIETTALYVAIIALATVGRASSGAQSVFKKT